MFKLLALGYTVYIVQYTPHCGRWPVGTQPSDQQWQRLSVLLSNASFWLELMLFLRPVQNRAGQGDTLWTLLCQRGVQQLPSRHALQAFWSFNESQEHICRNIWNGNKHHRAAGGQSGNLFTVLAQLQVSVNLTRLTWFSRLGFFIFVVVKISCSLTDWMCVFTGRCVFSRTDGCISLWFTLVSKVCRRRRHLWRKWRGWFSCWKCLVCCLSFIQCC